MANTTNFGWETPDDTDLVKDGAAAMRTLGNAIDASFVDLKGGTTGQVLAKASNTDLDFTWSSVDPLTILDAKGDLISATAADTPARMAVGADGTYLQADSSTATGLKWGTVSAGGMTLLSTTTLTGNVVNVTSINQTYTHLFLEWYGVTNTNANDEYVVRLNGSGSGHYLGAIITSASATGRYTNDSMRILAGANNLYTDANNGGGIWVYNYSAGHRTTYSGASIFYNSGASAVSSVNFAGGFDSSSAITSVTFATRGGESFNSGTLKIYGVK